MTEYIEREKVINLLKKYGIKRGNKVYGIADIGYITMSVEDIPAADVAPVVRCKDCKFWDFGDCYRLELSRPDDFCSYGERKAE